MVRDEDRRALLDPLRDSLRARICALLPLLLPVLPKLTDYERDQWAEWLVRERYAGRTQEEVETIDSSLAAVRDRVLDRARFAPGDVVLDVGTGTGLLAVGALDRVGPEGSVVCLDISVDCLEELRASTPDPRLSFLVGSAEVLPLPDGSVDVCVLRSVLIYVREKGEAARELHRVLCDGGRLSFFEPVNRRSTKLWELVDFGPLEKRVITDFHRRWPADDPMHDFDVDDMERLFSDAGFDAIDIDVAVTSQTIEPESALHGVGAPGKPSFVEAWAETFSPDEVDALAAAVRAAGPTTPRLPVLYFAATKP